MFEADITKVVEEMSIQVMESEEEFIFKTIRPYCENILQREINKKELKQIILRGSRPKGKWIRELLRNEKGGCIGAKMICSECNNDNKHDEYMRFCPNCGADMRGENNGNMD